MRASLIKDLAVWITGVGLAMTIFYFWNPLPDKIDLTISYELEEDLANRLMPLFKDQFEVLEDSLVETAVHKIRDRLMVHMESSEYDYKIMIVEENEINAFTFLNGNVVIFSGLLLFAESAEEVAAVLAHEMGHVESRHVLHKMGKELGISILLSATGGNQSLLKELAKTVVSNTYDRSQEKEADNFALALLDKSSVDPASVATFFRRINREKGTIDENLELLLTHPHNNSRIKAAISYKKGNEFEEIPLDIDWDEIRKRLQ